MARTRGRPRDLSKRASLVVSARELFLRHGVDGVTVDQIITAAKVSRATYYSNFTGRDELLAEVIAWESRRIVSEQSALAYGAAKLREALVDFGDGFMHFLADPDTMRLDSLILQVGQARPELAASLFAAGPKRVWNILARIVRDGQERGELGPVDPDEAVNDLIGLWRGSWYVEVMYGQRGLPSEDELRRRSRHAVDLFLGAHQAID